MRVKRLVAVAAASVFLVGVTGCGGDDVAPAAEETTTEASPVEPVETESSESSESEEPAEVAEEPAEGPGEQSGGYDAEELLAAMKAAVIREESAHMVMEMAGGGQTMSAEGDVSYAGKGTAMQLTMKSPELGPGVIEVRLVDNVMYMSMPPMTPQGKFLKFDLDDPNSPLGSLGSVTQGDPMETFEAFDMGLRDVKYLGAEEVDGVEADHYVLTVDGKAAAKAQGLPAGTVPEELTYDLWLDRDDLMRRVQYTMAGGGVTISMSEWGEPVTVKAPPKSDIMQLPTR